LRNQIRDKKDDHKSSGESVEILVARCGKRHSGVRVGIGQQCLTVYQYAAYELETPAGGVIILTLICYVGSV
jgi:putative flippase GtrA